MSYCEMNCDNEAEYLITIGDGVNRDGTLRFIEEMVCRDCAENHIHLRNDFSKIEPL